MKSDREFLQGVYEKAESLDRLGQTELGEGTLSKKQWGPKFNIKPVYLRYAMLAAVFAIVITSGVFLKSFKVENEIEKPQTFGLTSRGMPIMHDEQQMWDRVTDVVEVKASKNKSAFILVKVYKGHTGEKEILNHIKDHITDLENGQTSLVLLQVHDKDMVVLDVYYSDKEGGTYRNLSNEVLTKDSLKEHIID